MWLLEELEGGIVAASLVKFYLRCLSVDRPGRKRWLRSKG